MPFSRIVSVALLVGSIVAAEATMSFAQLFQFFPELEPDASYVISPPYRDSAVAEQSELGGIRFALTECSRSSSFGSRRSFFANAYDSNRTVSVDAGNLNLLNGRIVNGIVVAALRVAWRHCYSIAPYRHHAEFGGVRVLVLQAGKLAVETERVRADAYARRIAFGGFTNQLADQARAEEERRVAAEQERQRQIAERAAAERAAKANAAWGASISIFSRIALVLAALFLIVRYGPVTLAFIRFHLFPHRAAAHINRATQGKHAAAMDVNAFAEALRNHEPINEPDVAISEREVNAMREKAEQYERYMRAREDLAKKVTEMELLRERVEAMERYEF